MKHALYADVLVHVGPVDALTRSDDAEIRPLCLASFGEPPGPSQGNADDPPIYQLSSDLITGDTHRLDARVATGRSAHAKPPESRLGGLRRAVG